MEAVFMKKSVMLKQFISLAAVSVLLVLCLLPAAVLAEEDQAEPDEREIPFRRGGFGYALLEDNTVEILDYTGKDTRLNIPKSIGGYPVSSIGEDAFFGNETLRAVRVPEGVKTLGKNAFGSCIYLEKVTLPQGLTSVGAWAFHQCEALASLSLPDTGHDSVLID